MKVTELCCDNSEDNRHLISFIPSYENRILLPFTHEIYDLHVRLCPRRYGAYA